MNIELCNYFSSRFFLLLCALHAWSMAFFVIVAHVTLLCTGLLAGIHLGQTDLLDVGGLGEHGQGCCRWEDGAQLFNVGQVGPVGGRELDLELDVQVAKVMVSLCGHSLAHHCLQLGYFGRK